MGKLRLRQVIRVSLYSRGPRRTHCYRLASTQTRCRIHKSPKEVGKTIVIREQTWDGPDGQKNTNWSPHVCGGVWLEGGSVLWVPEIQVK